MLGIGFGELLVVLMIGLFLFGNYLPRIAHSLGMTVGEFRREARSLEEDISLPSP